MKVLTKGKEKSRLLIILSAALMSTLMLLITVSFLGPPSQAAANEIESSPVLCENGFAGPYPCQNVDLISQLSILDMGGTSQTTANDLWGWTDPLTAEEYVLMGLSDGTAFVNITDAENPQYLGILPTHTISSTWRDIKVYEDYAFIVADQPSLHGMQVFDLNQLRTITAPVTFSETAYYGGFGNGHNLFINEDTGYAYVVRTETCSGALHMIDLQDPLNPSFAGCFDDDGLTSDMQCVVYSGPDAEYLGHEICFIGSDDAFTVGDVTDKNAPIQISHLTYPGVSRAHQGWLTEDQSFFLLSDTKDEVNLGTNTRTYMWDVSDIDNVVYMGYYEHGTASIDHNVFILGNYAYETNFRAGLRILDVSNISAGQLEEVAFFDVDPASDSPVKTGAWSSYPWFDSGVLPVSDTEQGLFILQPQLDQEPTDVALGSFKAFSNHTWASSMLVGLLILLSVIFYRIGRAIHSSVHNKII